MAYKNYFNSCKLFPFSNPVNLGFDSHNPISETFVQSKIANTVWAGVGLKRVLSKNEVGSDCEDLLFGARDAAKSSTATARALGVVILD